METPQERIADQIELQSQRYDHDQEDIAHEGILPQQLKPADRGRDAWTVLIAGFIFEALFWGT